MQRILRGTPATLTFSYQDSDGASASPTGTVTVTVTREDGTVLLAAGTATTTQNNLRTVALTAANTTRLDVLRADWTNGSWTQTTYHEVVGGFYCSIDAIRDSRNIGTNSEKFPNELVIEARTWFEDLAEEHCGVAFVPRYHRETFKGDGTARAMLDKWPLRSLLAVSISGEALEEADWENWTRYEHGLVVRNTDVFTVPTSETAEDNVSIAYEHGFDAPPETLRQAALVAIRSKLITDRQGLPSSELSVMSDLGLVRVSQPGTEYPTGIPFVDSRLNKLRAAYKPPVVA